MKKLKLKDIYNKVNHNPYCQITNIINKYTLKSNVKNLFKNYWQIILIFSVIITIFFIYTFWSKLILVVYSLMLILFLFIATIYYNAYRIIISEEELKFNINLQNNSIPYDKLGNIYLSKDNIKFFFIPIYYYNIKITYLLEENKIGILSFPTFMLNKEDILKFFSSFEFEAYKNEQDEIEKEEKDKKNTYKALGIAFGILFIALFIVAIFIYSFIK